MLVRSLDPANSDTWVAALTTAEPTMCHIEATDIAPPLTSAGDVLDWLLDRVNLVLGEL